MQNVLSRRSCLLLRLLLLMLVQSELAHAQAHQVEQVFWQDNAIDTPAIWNTDGPSRGAEGKMLTVPGCNPVGTLDCAVADRTTSRLRGWAFPLLVAPPLFSHEAQSARHKNFLSSPPQQAMDKPQASLYRHSGFPSVHSPERWMPPRSSFCNPGFPSENIRCGCLNAPRRPPAP